MSEQSKPMVEGTTVPESGQARIGGVDLLAFLGALLLAGGVTLLADQSGHFSSRLAFAGGAGLVAACVTAWRRLRRPELRRWRSGQAVYRGHRVTMVSTWGVEGQSAPEIPPVLRDTTQGRPDHSCGATRNQMRTGQVSARCRRS